MITYHQDRQETAVYAALWAILVVAPFVSIYFHHPASYGSFYPWDELFGAWRQMAVYLLLFLLHNYLLAPLIVYRRQRVAYFTLIAIIVACFFAVQCMDRPQVPVPFVHDGALPPPPPLFLGQRDIVATLILVLMLGMNLGVKLYFKQRRDEQRLEQLEKENLEQQLQYLRYQINPHFLMNTLNNIHALVDIDAEQAKTTIVELSKLMRYALYEGAKQQVPLSRDVDFLQSYLLLMRLRYTDRVAIKVDIADSLPQCQVPPMLFITFVENAFKHGISYQQLSYIDVSLHTAGGRLVFTCSNSKPALQQPRQTGGVGLQNARRRLDLIYAENYSLSIDDGQQSYSVQLQVPVYYPFDLNNKH